MKSSIVFVNGRLSSISKFFCNLCKDKSSFSNNEGNFLIHQENNSILFRIISNGKSSCYEYFIQNSSDLLIERCVTKSYLVNIYDFIEKIYDEELDNNVKIQEINGNLSFE